MATYTIKKGDNLLDIAKKYNVSTSTILDANPGVSGLSPGVTLRIPTVQQSAQQLQGSGSSWWEQYLPQEPTTPTTPPTGFTGIPEYIQPYIDPKTGQGLPPTEKKKGGGGTQVPIPPRFQPPPGVPYTPPSRPKTPPPAPRGYVPPPISMAELEARRVPQPPVVGYTGAQRPQPPVTIGERIFGLDFRTRPISSYLDRLFRRGGRPDQPVVSLTGAQRPNYWQQFLRGDIRDPATWQNLGTAARQVGKGVNEFFGHYGPRFQPAQAPPLEPSRVGGVPSPTTFDQFLAQGLSPEQARVAILQAGVPSGVAPPTVGTLEYDPVSGFPVFEGGELGRHSSIIEWYLDNGKLPFSLYAEDVARFGWTDAELLAAGYIEDAYGNWIRVGMEPTGAEVAGGGGEGYGYGGYPSYGYPSYGYPVYGGGGGGGGYTYPQSFVGREGTPYPQSFVQRGQRGVSPTGRSTRPARFGAVTWRI